MTDDAVDDALIARRNRRIEAVRAQDRAEGRAEGALRGRAETVLAVLAARGVAVGAADRQRILAERDAAQLERWAARAATCATAGALFAV